MEHPFLVEEFTPAHTTHASANRLATAETQSPAALPPLPNLSASEVLFLTPSDSQYASYLASANLRTQLSPALRAVCKTEHAVAVMIDWVSSNNLSFGIRCGGHSYEGFSQSQDVVIDLRGLEQSTREPELRRQIKHEAAKPFDLARDPLFRCVLFRITDNDWLLMHNSPHIVFDGGSVAVLYRDLAAFYNAFLSGTSPSLPKLPFQFADFAAWQRRLLQRNYLASLNEYWSQQLASAPNVNMPLDFARPTAHQHLGTRKFFTIPPDLLAKASGFFKAAGTTAYRGLYSVFNILLLCYTGLEDICMGTPVAPTNAACRGIENLVGHFVNTLVLRSDLSGDPTFREVIR